MKRHMLCTAITLVLFAVQVPAADYVIPDLKASMWATSTGETIKCSPEEMPGKINQLKPGQILLVDPGILDREVTIYVSGTEDAPITIRAKRRHHTRLRRFALRGDYLVIDGFELTGGDLKKGTCGRIDADVAWLHTGCQMLNNYIHDTQDYGIRTGKKALVQGNLMRRVTQGFYVRGGSLIEGNELDTLKPTIIKEDANKKVYLKTCYAFFVGNDVVFRGNYFHGTAKGPLKQGMGVDFFTSYSSVCKFSSNILIENNVCFNATHGSEPTLNSGTTSSNYIVRNNVFSDCVYVGLLPQNFTKILIENNTLINCGAYPIWFGSKRMTEGSMVRNNVIAYVNHAANVEEYDWTPAESGIRNNSHPDSPIVSENNMFDGCKNRGYGKTDFSAKPIFMDPANKDFRLKPGSPGFDKGLGISQDIVANPVPCEAPGQ